MDELDRKDVIVMKLLHYFITEQNYSPVVLHGAKNEIWLENMDSDYKIVGSQEADPFESKISNESPIAKALMGHKVGDIVNVESPNGSYEIKIVEIG